MLSKTVGGAEFDYRLARYGAGIGEGETSPVAIAVADPVDGCEDKAYKVRSYGTRFCCFFVRYVLLVGFVSSALRG